MLHRTERKEIDDYFASPALNQSRFKKLIQGRSEYLDETAKTEKQLYYEEKGHFIIGSGVDCLLSTPDDFDAQYFYKEIDKPSDVIKSLAHMVFDSYKQENKEVPATDSEEFMQRTHEKLSTIKFYKARAKDKWINDSRMKTIGDLGYYKYIDGIREAEGKQIIDITEKEIIYRVHDSLTTNPTTSELFKDKSDCNIYFQKPFYFVYRGYQCKAMLDRLEINHKKRYIQFDELKTMTGKTKDFNFSMRDRRYDIQVSWYATPVFKQIINSATGRYKDYEVLPPRFIVESTTHTGTPRIFICTEEIMHMGKVGRSAIRTEFHSDEFGSVSSRYIPEIWGYDRCIDEIEWYNENGWEIDRDIVESGGRFKMDWSTCWPNYYETN